MKSGSLKLLEPSGPHRACYRTSLPFTLSGNNNAYFSYNFLEVFLLPLVLLVEVSDGKSQLMLYLCVYCRATITGSDPLLSLKYVCSI
jgi:hypothetical protein